MRKTIILDTNVILHDPHCIFKLGNHDIVIPSVVLEELDKKKRQADEVGRNARLFSRLLKEIRKGSEGKLSQGVPLETGGTFRVELNHRSFEHIKNIFIEQDNDNRIIAIAVNIQKEYEAQKIKKDVVLISNDSLVIAKADALGIQVEEYENDRLVNQIEHVHKGFHKIDVPSDIIDRFYKEKTLPVETIASKIQDPYFEQDFFILKSEFDPSKSALCKLVNKQNKFVLEKLHHYPEKEEVWGVKAKNVQQRMMMDLALNPAIELLVVTGQAGTGKTLLALAAGLKQTEDFETKRYKKMLVARPVIPMGKDIGFLPGEKEDKLRPWMQPIYDNLEYLFRNEMSKNEKNEKKKTIDEIIAQLNIEVEALTYIRGRSIPEQLIIIDEAQNLSPHEVKTIISRAGIGTKVVLIGDPEQIDHPYLDSINNGLTYVIERMKQEPNTGIVHLKKTERSNLAEKAAELL